VVTIKKIGIGSAFRVGAVVSAILWLILGLFFLLFQSWFLTAAMSSPEFGGQAGQFQGLGVMTLFFSYLCGIPLYAVIGGLVGALYAFVYNLTAGWVGGVQVQIDSDANTTDTGWGPVKPKIGDRDL
jgi:hypothetical protein